ncbi:serine protease 7 [Drosophila suzukii]|uniref:Serine protease 7 n=1 Tax=Drosophila suzukii TaxID=28584 RepID=A0AB40DFK0_DROSZ
MKVLTSAFLCILLFHETKAQYKKCHSEKRGVGNCMTVEECPIYYSGQANQFAGPQKDHFFSFECEPPLVCCLNQKVSGRIISLLPQPPTCGGSDAKYKVFGGVETDLDEFPWLAMLEYQKRNVNYLTTNCAGSLMNHRYVLTAAHCLKGRFVERIGELASVRLGEHDTRTDEDCSGRMGRCSPKFQRLGFKEIRVHEGFQGMLGSSLHDIGLIRLERNVVYSHSIRPICLPSTVPSAVRFPGRPLTVAGWGTTSTLERSPTKQKAELNYVKASECRRFWQAYIHLESTQLCAGKIQTDSCTGDSGGPLMQLRDGIWVQEGIVSFGIGCAIKNRPGVYTDVAAYDTWIRQNVVARDGDYVELVAPLRVVPNQMYGP